MAENRLRKLQRLMQEHEVQLIALNPGPSLKILTGLDFHLMERPTVLFIQSKGTPILVLPELEMQKIKSAGIYLETVPFGDDPATWQIAFQNAIRKLSTGNSSIGVESSKFRYLEISLLQKVDPSIIFFESDAILSELRICKEEHEINFMRKAVRIAQDALSASLPNIHPGVTEKEIAGRLTAHLLSLGSDPELPFSPIVASGPNSANPHAVPTDRKLQVGDMVIIDWGARYNGYCSDLTRTFAIGNPPEVLREAFHAVQVANQAGRVEGKPGITAGNVDLAARKVIETAGFGDFFTHRTGHGIGLEDHEPPYIFEGNEQLLTPGMTYTVEPGIYLPGKGGIRIEDNMIVTPSGSESLSDYPRDLVIL